jgi:hypothetical protein
MKLFGFFSFVSKKGVSHIATVEVEATFAKHTLHLSYIYPICDIKNKTYYEENMEIKFKSTFAFFKG